LTAAEPAATHAAAPAPRIRAWDVLLVGAFLVGAALRAWQIDIQILIDDEWHAVHKLLRSGPVDIVTHLGYADYSIPLTLYFQALYRTIGLSEWGMHLPSLLAGIGLLLVGPRLLARSFARPTQAIWTTLVAISPLLVYHSKIARPYALTSLLTFVAIIAFRAWWIDRRSRDALLYAANLPPAFFDLSSRLAGEYLQKWRNYRIRVAVVCPASVTFSTRFGEMLAEEAGRGFFRVFGTRDEATAWLEEVGDEAAGG
jgi:hypothetical protein